MNHTNKEEARKALNNLRVEFGKVSSGTAAWGVYDTLVKGTLEKYFQKGVKMTPKDTREDNLVSNEKAVFLLISPDPERKRFLTVGVYLHRIDLREANYATSSLCSLRRTTNSGGTSNSTMGVPKPWVNTIEPALITGECHWVLSCQFLASDDSQNTVWRSKKSMEM